MTFKNCHTWKQCDKNTECESEVITENFALSPYATSSWAEGSCRTFRCYSFVPPPHCINGIAAHAWKFLWCISKPTYDCNQDNTMAASGIKRKQRTKYQNFSLQRSSLHNQKQDGSPCTYSPIHYYLSFNVMYRTKQKSTKQKLLPSSLNVQCLICVLEVYVSSNSSSQLLSNSCSK